MFKSIKKVNIKYWILWEKLYKKQTKDKCTKEINKDKSQN